MDESALKILLDNLDKSQTSLHHWLHLWTFLVVVGVALEVVGVALEIVFVIREYAEDLHDFRRGIVQPPEKPSRLLLVLGLLGAGLVAVGVAGELYIDVQAGKVETDLRNANELRVSLLSKEAADANKKAQEASDRASANAIEAAGLRKEAEGERLARIAIQDEVAWRKLTKDQIRKFRKVLEPFSGQQTVIEHDLNDIEAGAFALDLGAALKNAAHWDVRGSVAAVLIPVTGIPIEQMTPIQQGVDIIGTSDEKSGKAAIALIRELVALGFDAKQSSLLPPPGSSTVSVIINHRPEGPQGAAKLRHEAKSKKRQNHEQGAEP
jgi:hypothetical protein